MKINSGKELSYKDLNNLINKYIYIVSKINNDYYINRVIILEVNRYKDITSYIKDTNNIIKIYLSYKSAKRYINTICNNNKYNIKETTKYSLIAKYKGE